MSRSPIAFRIQKFLRGLRYPVLKDEAIAYARLRGADEELLAALAGVDGDGPYDSPVSLSRRLS